MAADSNKDVVRRFINEVLAGGQLGRIDELVAPGYVNRAFGTGLEAFKGMLVGLSAALPDRRFNIEDLVAEADAVAARYTAEMRDRSGKTITVRGLTFYRLTGGKIVEDDPVTTPDLAQELGPLLGPPPT
jgi:predicted SnoaL-like aldol condensation-catalyzing enzyme